MGLSGNWAKAKASTAEPKQSYGVEYYRDLLAIDRTNTALVRMALVAKENCAKTGLALDIALAHTDKKVVIIDIDSSAGNTVDFLVGQNPKLKGRIQVVPVIDEMDEAMWNEDNSTNWLAVVDKLKWFIKIIAEDVENIGAVVFDGGSTFMKMCEFVMTDSLLRRGIIKEDGDGFNQKEWRERNSIFKSVLDRLTALPVPYMFFTFHLKDDQKYMDVGDGTKALMTVGEKVDWVKGTQRLVSQQVWLKRYTKKGDRAAGVEADKSLGDGDWVVRGTIEEMKGRNMEHLGKTYDILEVRGNKVKWHGLPFEWK